MPQMMEFVSASLDLCTICKVNSYVLSASNISEQRDVLFLTKALFKFYTF